MFGRFQEDLLRDAAISFDHFRCVAGEVATQDLENAAGMLKRFIGFVLTFVSSFTTAVLAVSPSRGVLAGVVRGRLGSFVQPGLRAIGLLVSVPTRKNAAQIFRV